VWGKTTPAERHELTSRLHLVCDTSEARLKVEFSEHDTPAHFGCFDILRIKEALADGAAPHLKQRLLNKARCLARDFKLNPAMFILEYNELLPAIVASDAAQRFCVASNGVADNRPLWNETVLSEAWREATFPSRPAPFVEVVPMVRIWNSIDHGEGQVELDIGEMRARKRSTSASVT
jgi:hypothetical protein